MSRRCGTRITRRGRLAAWIAVLTTSAAIGFALPNPLNACTQAHPCPLERTR